MSKEIWADLPNSKLTFFSAGSYELFEKQAPNVQKEIKKEFTIIEEPNDKAIKKSKKLGYLPTKSKTASVNENRGDFLPSTTQMAIDYLSSRSTNGFFLMVEGARIDKSAHSNDYSAVVMLSVAALSGDGRNGSGGLIVFYDQSDPGNGAFFLNQHAKRW